MEAGRFWYKSNGLVFGHGINPVEQKMEIYAASRRSFFLPNFFIKLSA